MDLTAYIHGDEVILFETIILVESIGARIVCSDQIQESLHEGMRREFTSKFGKDANWNPVERYLPRVRPMLELVENCTVCSDFSLSLKTATDLGPDLKLDAAADSDYDLDIEIEDQALADQLRKKVTDEIDAKVRADVFPTVFGLRV